MKKILMFGLILAVSSTAFAEDKKEEAKTKINAGFTARAYSTFYHTTTKTVEGSYSAIRFRPLLTITNDSLSGVLELSYEAMFGAKDGASDQIGLESKSSTSDAPDSMEALRVRQGYLSTKVDSIAGLTLNGGISAYDFPLVFGDTAPMFNAIYERGNTTLALYYGKTYEGDKLDSKDDASFGIIDATVKVGDHKIRPAVFYIQSKKNADEGTDASTVYPGTQFKRGHGVIGALATNFVFGKFGIDAAGALVHGQDKAPNTSNGTTYLKTTKTKYSSYAADIAPYFAVNDSLKFTVFGTIVSGDKDTTGQTNTSFLSGTLDGKSSGINSWRLLILEDGGSFSKFCDPADSGKYTNTKGYIAGGLAVDYTIDKFTARLLGAYARTAKGGVNSNGISYKKDMGIETDLKLSYLVTKGATLFVESAYLKSGNYYKAYVTDSTATAKKQDAYYINAGLDCAL